MTTTNNGAVLLIPKTIASLKAVLFNNAIKGLLKINRIAKLNKPKPSVVILVSWK